MGADIHVHILVNKEKEGWERVQMFYKKNEDYKSVSPYDCRNYELFSILQGDETYFPSTSINFNTLPKDLAEEIKTAKDLCGYYSFYEFNMADAMLYLKEHPKVIDDNKTWDTDPENPIYKDNPIKSFLEAIEQYINFAQPLGWWGYYSNIRVIYYFDR